MCTKTDNPRVYALALKLCQQIDESYKNLDVEFVGQSALKETAVNAVKFWADQAKKDVLMNKLRPGYWISVLTFDREAVNQMKAYEEFIKIAGEIQ